MKSLLIVVIFLYHSPLRAGDGVDAPINFLSKGLSSLQRAFGHEFSDKKFSGEIVAAGCENRPLPSGRDLREELESFKQFNRDTLYDQLTMVESNLPFTDKKILNEYGIDPLTVKDVIKRAREVLAENEKMRKTAQLCLFKKELTAEIRHTVVIKNKDLLKKLEAISHCLTVKKTGQNLLPQNFTGVFDAIFSEFSNKKDLTSEDCSVLKKTYQIWASSYEQENFKEKEESIPFYNVNPHNSAYFYWLKERQKGTIPEGGLSLLHLDTHTDLGHVHSFNRSSYFRDLAFYELPNLLYTLKGRGKEAVLEEIRHKKALNEKSREHLLSKLKTMSDVDITESLEQTIRASVHDIAQPLVGATISDITTNIALVLPPWSQRVGRSPIVGGKVQKLKVTLAQSGEAMRLMYREQDDNLNLEKSAIPTFGKIKDYNMASDFKVIKEGVNISVTDANSERRVDIAPGEYIVEPSESPLPPFSSYLESKKFLLDIDLDGFVSEGLDEGYDIEEPVSFKRTRPHQSEYSEHNGHQSSNENDPAIEVASIELDLIKKRVDSFFDRLEVAKKEGFTPAVITIADSTILERALEGQYNDSLSGGNYTPSCLVFLLNYTVRQKLKRLYQLNIRP